MTSSASPRTLCIAVPTHGRPERLTRCLQSLAGLESDFLEPGELVVLVADNNADGSAKPIVDRFAEEELLPIAYLHVPEPGLCMVRNAILGFVQHRFDYVAMIDDDEIAGPPWARELYEACIDFQADFVMGRVETVYEAGVPEWFKRSGMGHSSSGLLTLPKGAPAPKRATNNLLLRTAILQGIDRPWFPLELNFTGSEDRAFFLKASAAGFNRVIWNGDAVVTDPVIPERSTPSFFVKRSRQRGSSEVVAEAVATGKGTWNFASLAKTAKLLTGAVLMTPLLIPPRTRYQALRKMLYVCGRLRGHCCGGSEAYGRPATVVA